MPVYSRQLTQCESRDKLHEPKPANLDLAQVLGINNFPLIPTYTYIAEEGRKVWGI